MVRSGHNSGLENGNNHNPLEVLCSICRFGGLLLGFAEMTSCLVARCNDDMSSLLSSFFVFTLSGWRKSYGVL